MPDHALHQAVLKLPEDERADLLDALIASLPVDPDVEQAWADEVARRLDELESGRATTVPAEEVFAFAHTSRRPGCWRGRR